MVILVQKHVVKTQKRICLVAFMKNIILQKINLENTFFEFHA